MKLRCGFCGGQKFWKLGEGGYRCQRCRRDKSPYPIKGVRLTEGEWQKLLTLFLLGANSPTLKEELHRSLGLIGKALKKVRISMTKDVPRFFSGTVEVDETYLGGQKKNRRKSQLARERQTLGRESRSGRGTTKQPVFGILARSGQVYARLVDDIEAQDLLPIITHQVRRGAQVCSDTWRAYTGLAVRGYVHRTVEHGEGEYVGKRDKKNHINGLEGFWGFLKRKLASKGGVRRHYLPIFLGEYVWRFNYRTYSLKEKRKKLWSLIESRFGARS
jgi:transposase